MSSSAAAKLTLIRNLKKAPIEWRQPLPDEGRRIWRFIKDCGGLDLNSVYYYHIFCRDFAATSAVAILKGEIVGFCSAYRRPNDPRVLFIWQIGTARDCRGQGVGKRLVDDILNRSAADGVTHLAATIAPGNKAVSAMFEHIARHYRAPVTRLSFLESTDFPEDHAPEILLSIGPLHHP